MQELQTIADVLNSLGVSALFGPLLALIILVYTLKKYVLAGAGTFLKEITSQYIKQNNERIVLETQIDIKLSNLTTSIEKFITELVGIEKRNSDRIADVKRDLSDRLHNIEIVLSDKLFGEINELRDIVDDSSLGMTGKRRADKLQLAMMDTETFRVKREEARKELVK